MSATSDIRPTRLEYIRTKRRIVIAKKGLKLLKLKRQALILEFFNTSKTATALRENLQSELDIHQSHKMNTKHLEMIEILMQKVTEFK